MSLYYLNFLKPKSGECQVPTCVGCTGKAEKASTGVEYDNFGGLDCM